MLDTLTPLEKDSAIKVSRHWLLFLWLTGVGTDSAPEASWAAEGSVEPLSLLIACSIH
jgi:hypothetical protein